MSQETTTTRTEDQLRRSLRQQGLAMHKDRARTISINRQGGYMIVDAYTNAIMAGERFDVTLEDVAKWLTE